MDNSPQNSPIKRKRTPKPAKTERQQNFVRNLRWAIERLGLTLRALHEKAGVDELWLRRAATRGIKWTKPSGTEAVNKLEAFLGCPTGTLWDEDGHRFRSAVADKHLRGRDPVSNFEKVFRHFEASPPPLLSRVIENIEYLRRTIEEPGVEPPKEENPQLPNQSSGGTATWDQSSGWRFSEAGIDYLIASVNERSNYADKIGVPGASDMHLGREEIERLLAGLDFNLSALAYVIWMDSYEAKYGIPTDEVDRLFRQRQSAYEASLAEQTDQPAREVEAPRTLEATQQEKRPLADKMKTRRATEGGKT